MGGLFGAKKSSVTVPTYTSLHVQTAAQGIPIPIGWGQFRAGANIVWYNNFQRHAVKQKSGKGGGSSTTSYTYTAAVILGICEGPIQSIPQVWENNAVVSLSYLNLELFGGAVGQAVWSYLTTSYSAQALNYSGTGYVASSNYSLGTDANLPSHNFEVKGFLSGSMPYGSLVDANPADVINDFLNNTQYGIGYNWATNPIDNASWTQFKTYCQVFNIFFSPYINNQEQGISIIQRWAQLSNTFIFWSGNVFKFVPLGTNVNTNNGLTYTPNLTVIYDLTYSNFILEGSGSKGPIEVTRSDPADGYNQVQLDIRDRANNYNTTSIVWKDQASIDANGQLAATTVQADEICDINIATYVAALIGQRATYIRNTYTFKLPYNFVLLEPGDIVTINDPNIGLSQFPVRILSVEEDDKQILSIIAEEFPAGIGQATAYVANTATGTAPFNIGVNPGNVNSPAIIEPNAAATGGQPQVWISLSGGQYWGGADVYISFDGGTTYSMIDEYTTPSTQGVLVSSLASHADPDTSDTLVVNLTESNSSLPATATNSDADAFRTLILVDNELMSYGSAVPGSGANYFNLTYLRRGLYGTAIAAHSAGATFTRVDPATVFQYDLPQQYVGSTLYFKFTSFNIFGQNYQDISAVTAYSYTTTGEGFYIAPPTGASLAASRVTQSDGTSLLLMTLTWTASVGPIIGSYEIQVSTDSGVTWTNGGTVGAGVANFVINPALASTNYQLRVRAISTTGINISAWNNSATVNSGTIVGAVPSAPTGVTSSAFGAAAALNWTLNADVTVNSYQIWRAATTGAFSSATQIASVGLTNAYTDFTTAASTQYSYYIVAVNGKGSSSPSTASVVTTSTSSSGGPYDIPMSFTGQPVASYRFYRVVLARNVSFLSNFAGSYLQCRVAPAASYTITILKNGASVGTGTIAAGSTTGTYTTSGAITFSAGDLLEIDGPSSADSALTDLSITITGTR